MNRSTFVPSPQSQTRWPADSFTWWRSLIVLAALAGAAGVGFLLAGIVLIAVYGFRNRAALTHPSLDALLGAQFLAYIPIVIVLLALLPWLARVPLRVIGFRSLSLADIAWAIGGAVGMTIVTSAAGAVEQSIFHLSVNETAVDIMNKAHGVEALSFALLACVAAPFVEELIFRGFVFNAIRRYAPLWLAVTLGGVIFGAAHYDGHSAGAIVPLMFGGAVLCIVYYVRRVIWVDMLAHAIFNALPVTLVLVFHQKVT